MTIITHLDKLTNQAADRYTFYRESNHKLAAKFGEIAVRLWHKRMTRLNEDIKKTFKKTFEKIKNDIANKPIISTVDPKDCWDSGLAMWICYDCNISIRQDDKPDKCPNCKNKDLHKRI
jgi:rubrerythrin